MTKYQSILPVSWPSLSLCRTWIRVVLTPILLYIMQVQTLDMDDYMQATSDHILAQLFFRKQSEFKKIPRFPEDQAINLP